MSDFSIARSVRVALAATFLIPFAGAALAQTADGRSSASLEKEAADLRAKIRRVKLQKEVDGLHAELDQLQGRRPVRATTGERAEGAPQQLVTRIETTSGDRTLVMADMPMKAVAAPVPYYSWSGFYFGGNIGYGVGNDRAQANLTNVLGSNLASGDFAVAPSGAIGGVQLGFNYQVTPNWLFGFEADVQGSDQNGKSCLGVCEILQINTQSGTLQYTTTNKLDYFGTIRGRAGFVDGGNLFYVTGGGAYGRVNQTYETTLAQSGAGQPSAASFGSASTTENKFGWVIGAGLESSLGGNWTGKIEYLYMDLGNTATSLTTPIPGGGAVSTMVGSTSIRDNIVRAGLNYRLGPSGGSASAYDAMAAVPPAVYSWTGFYVGANLGYGFGNHHTQSDISEDIGGVTATGTGAPGTSVNPKGVLGGVQLGYNWQVGPRWVIGFETDLQGSTQKDTACVSITCGLGTDTNSQTGTNFFTVKNQIDFFSTARGRVGYVANNTLFYATGGVAFAEVKQNVDINSTVSTPAILISGGTSKDMTGFVVGGGIEAMMGRGWSTKAEYLYMDLGSINTTLNFNAGFPTSFTTNTTVRDHIVRLGVNYHIGAAPY